MKKWINLYVLDPLKIFLFFAALAAGIGAFFATAICVGTLVVHLFGITLQ